MKKFCNTLIKTRMAPDEVVARWIDLCIELDGAPPKSQERARKEEECAIYMREHCRLIARVNNLLFPHPEQASIPWLWSTEFSVDWYWILDLLESKNVLRHNCLN